MPKENVANLWCWSSDDIGGLPTSDKDLVDIIIRNHGNIVRRVDNVKFCKVDEVLDAWIADGCKEGNVQERYRAFVALGSR